MATEAPAPARRSLAIPSIAIHATAVALDAGALVIRGPSRSGKSTLALALIARSRLERPVVLVADDRVLLCRREGSLSASPHPRIAGLIERRGGGILALPYRSGVPVLGIVNLSPATGCDLAGENFPALALVEDKWDTRAVSVLAWAATLRARFDAKAGVGAFPPAED